MTSTTVQLADAQHPWIGLASFTEGDCEFFAGRGEEIDELLRLVHRDTLTLLYGVSGLGKTSLLQAGIFPAVRSEDWLPVAIRLDYSESAQALAAQILGAISTKANAAGVETPKSRFGETLWEYFHRVGNHFWSPRNDLVTPFLVFDQFEEAFTLGRENPARVRRVLEFISEFADLVENRPPAALRDDPQRAREFSFKPAPLRVLLAMREDYIAELDRLRSQFRALDQNRLRLLPMGAPQAREVIELGAQLLAPGVADRIVTFTAGNAAAAAGDEIAVAPALLSLVLRELNERRLARGPDAKITPDLLAVEHQKILEDFYLRTLQDFPVGVRSFVEDELLTATGYRNSCALDDALSKPDVTQPFLDELVNRRLLAYEDRHHARRVEITHDILIPVVKASRDARVAREALKREETARKERAAKRRIIAFATVLAIACLWAASFLFLRSRKVEEALVDSIRRTVGVTLEVIPSYGERETLWDLSHSDVRQKIIDKWVTTKSLERALANNARGLHAAVGLDHALEGDFTSRNAKGAADTLVNALTKPQETDPNRLWSLGNALAALAPRLKPTEAAEVAKVLTDELGNSQDTISDRKASLGIALAGLLAGVNSPASSSQAEAGAKVLAGALKDPNPYRRWKLGTALAGLLAGVNSPASSSQAEAGAKVLARALKDPLETNPDRLSSLSDALAALAARLNAKDSKALADELANALETKPEELGPDRKSNLGVALAALTTHLGDPAKATLAKRGATVLANALRSSQVTVTDPYAMWKLSNAFAALAASLDAQYAAALANDMAMALEKKPEEPGPDLKSNLGIALAALTTHLGDPAKTSLAKRGATILANALLNSQVTDPYTMWKLSNALAALAASLDANHADALAADLAKALETKPEETGPDRKSSLGIALAAVVAPLNDRDKATLAAPGAKVLVDALKNLPETDSNHRRDLGNALAALAAQVHSAPQTQLFGLSNLFLREVPKEGAEGNETRKTITEVCHSLNPEELTEVLKWPFCVGEAQKLVLAALADRFGKEKDFDGDVWKFVEQAPSLGIKNLAGPAIRPTAEGALTELASLPTKGKRER